MYAKICREEFLLDCELRRLSGRTVKSYGNNVALFLQYLEQQLQIKEIEDIEKKHVQTVLDCAE